VNKFLFDSSFSKRYTGFTMVLEGLLADKKISTWLFKKRSSRDLDFTDLSIIGYGPYSDAEFSHFLSRHRFDELRPDSYTEVLVLGREGWHEKDLLRLRSGSTLRVYTQEMFLVFLLSGNDPLQDEAIAMRFGRGHSGIEALLALNFPWPTTQVEGFGPGRVMQTYWRSEGFLKAMGYSVGMSGLIKRGRHEKLDRAYRASVPKRFGEGYAAVWGKGQSARRLEQMAKNIAKFCRMAKGRFGDCDLAIQEWEADLRWLKRNYYRSPVFSWPSTKVR
jgi:hypothetical protein